MHSRIFQLTCPTDETYKAMTSFSPHRRFTARATLIISSKISFVGLPSGLQYLRYVLFPSWLRFSFVLALFKSVCVETGFDSSKHIAQFLII